MLLLHSLVGAVSRFFVVFFLYVYLWLELLGFSLHFLLRSIVSSLLYVMVKQCEHLSALLFVLLLMFLLSHISSWFRRKFLFAKRVLQ